MASAAAFSAERTACFHTNPFWAADKAPLPMAACSATTHYMLARAPSNPSLLGPTPNLHHPPPFLAASCALRLLPPACNVKCASPPAFPPAQNPPRLTPLPASSLPCQTAGTPPWHMPHDTQCTVTPAFVHPGKGCVTSFMCRTKRIWVHKHKGGRLAVQACGRRSAAGAQGVGAAGPAVSWLPPPPVMSARRAAGRRTPGGRPGEWEVGGDWGEGGGVDVQGVPSLNQPMLLGRCRCVDAAAACGLAARIAGSACRASQPPLSRAPPPPPLLRSL